MKRQRNWDGVAVGSRARFRAAASGLEASPDATAMRIGGLRGGRFLALLREKSDGAHGLHEALWSFPPSSRGFDARRLEPSPPLRRNRRGKRKGLCRG